MADKPVTREEKYLAYLTGDYTGGLQKPITRTEKYLYELCLKGIGGDISPEEIKNAVNEYLEKNPVKPGATTEQAQQIEQNKTDVTSLKKETSLLKEDLDKLNKGGLVLKDEVIEEDINNWLNEHPEATTTVQDGAITEPKIHADFLPYIKNIYVTPEMFGAVGDGIMDDTDAILLAIATGLPIRGLNGSKYAIKSQLEFTGDCNIKNIYFIAIESMNSVIKYNKRHTIIDNVQVNCNNLANYGILGSDSSPTDTLYFANISKSFVINALMDGFNTGAVRTFYNGCIAKLCKNAGFYIMASDTKHDCLTPIDCKYGVYVAAGNTNINSFHPWGWEVKQIGLYIKADMIANVQYYFNDTNDVGIAYDGGVKLTIHTLANINNQNAPSAVDENSRMLVKVGDITNSPSIFINNIIGSFVGNDDYFMYPSTDIGYIRVDNISLVNVSTRFDKKMFRSSYYPSILYNAFLQKLSISSSALNIDSVKIIELTANLRGYTVEFQISFESAKLTIDTMTDILQIYYLGKETNTAKYYLHDICASYSAPSFHLVRKKNTDGHLKGCSIRLNNDFDLDGILILYFILEIKLY